MTRELDMERNIDRALWCVAGVLIIGAIVGGILIGPWIVHLFM